MTNIKLRVKHPIAMQCDARISEIFNYKIRAPIKDSLCITHNLKDTVLDKGIFCFNCNEANEQFKHNHYFYIFCIVIIIIASS